MLLEPRADFYTGGHPSADDVLLLIEVADTSLHLDRRVWSPAALRYIAIPRMAATGPSRRRREARRSLPPRLPTSASAAET